MVTFWTYVCAFALGILACGFGMAILKGVAMEQDKPRDDNGCEMNEQQTLNYLVKGQRIELQFLGRIYNLLLEQQQAKAISATLTFVNSKGEHMPLLAHVNDVPGTAVFAEFTGPKGTGTAVPPTGAVTFASDTPAVATVDPNTGALAYLTAGTATISGTDAGNSLTASDVLTLTAAPAVSATLTLNPGVAAPPVG